MDINPYVLNAADQAQVNSLLAQGYKITGIATNPSGGAPTYYFDKLNGNAVFVPGQTAQVQQTAGTQSLQNPVQVSTPLVNNVGQVLQNTIAPLVQAQVAKEAGIVSPRVELSPNASEIQKSAALNGANPGELVVQTSQGIMPAYSLFRGLGGFNPMPGQQVTMLEGTSPTYYYKGIDGNMVMSPVPRNDLTPLIWDEQVAKSLMGLTDKDLKNVPIPEYLKDTYGSHKNVKTGEYEHAGAYGLIDPLTGEVKGQKVIHPTEMRRYAPEKFEWSQALPKGGTGVAEGFKSATGDYVRTAQGDIPAWMLVPDFKPASTPNNAPLATSAGENLVGVKYPFQTGGHKWVIKIASTGQQYGEVTDEMWTEAEYLKYIGKTAEQVRNEAKGGTILGTYSGTNLLRNQLFAQGDINSPFIDPKTGEQKLGATYGLIEKDTKQGSGGYAPVYEHYGPTDRAQQSVAQSPQTLKGVIAAGGGQGSIQDRWPTYATGKSPTKVVTNEPQTVKLADWAEDIASQMGVSQPVTELRTLSPAPFQVTADSTQVKIAGGAYVYKAEFDKLDPKYQQVLKNQGFEAYQSAVSNDYIKLPDSSMVLKSDYNNLDPRYQAILQSGGLDAFNKSIDMEYAKIPTASGSVLVSRTDIAQLPASQQQIFKEQGYEGLAKFVADNQQRLQGFTAMGDNGQSSIDILTALRSGEDNAINNLFTPKQIQDATQGKIVQATNPIELLQISGESLMSPAVVQGMARGYAQVLDSARDNLAQSLKGVRANDLNKAIENNKDIQAFNEVVDKEVKAGLNGWVKYADTFALPLVNEAGASVKQWVQDAPDWQKPARAVGGAVVDMIGIIPASIAATLTSAAAKGGLGQTQKATEGVTGLGAGAAGWFLTRPAAIVSDPLVEGPYTVAMLAGPGKMAAIARDTIVKTLPIPQKGTSISALGIDPKDVTRVNTPASISPAEARQILETIEYNSTRMIGTDVLPEILGKTRDQINITTDNGIGTGNLLVSGLQRAVPNLVHHASGGDFHNVLVNDLNTKGYFEVKSVDQGRGSVEFSSPQLAGSFLKENPAILNGMFSAKDLKKLPASIAEDLKNADNMEHARDRFYEHAYNGELEPGGYPLMKWYGDKNTLEYEIVWTPGFKWNAVKAPWYAKDANVKTATTFTTSPISNPEAGIKEGQRVPMYWVISDNALKDGRKMPSLGDLYKAEVYSTITDMRKALPQNIKLRDITLSEEGVATSTMISSKLKAVDIKGPDWANDPNAVMARVNSGQLEPYYRQRATAIVVDQSGKIVTVQEKNGNWSLPGGKIESGDTSINTILRELKEETGIKNPYRWERVGTLKDAMPLVSDQGSILWRDGKPVYNEHHVYLVKISREDSPVAKGEIKATDKVDWQNTGFKRTESFVKPVLRMIDEKTMNDFLAERRGRQVEISDVNSKPTTREWSKNRLSDLVVDDGKEVPYRLKVKSRIEGLEPSVSEHMVEPEIFTSYTASLRELQPSEREGQIATPSGESRIISMPERTTVSSESKPMTGEGRILTGEQRITTIPERVTVPTLENPVIPSKETSPAGGEKKPPITENPPMNPPEKPPVTPPPPIVPPPPDNPPIKGPPPIIPPPPTIRIKTEKGQREITQKDIEGAIAWKQGFIYKSWFPAYTQKDLLSTRKPIPGVKYFEGPGSAAKSIVALRGEIPDFLHAHMGIVDINVKGQGRAQPLLTFKDHSANKTVRKERDNKGILRGFWK